MKQLRIIEAGLELSLMNYFDEAHGALVMAAKIAHLEKHPEAENISKLIDMLEEIGIAVCSNTPFKD